MKKLYVGLDFDGTVVTHAYPEIGELIGATPVLKDIINAGHKIVLNTMRSGEPLEEAVAWFNKRDIPLYGVNNNPTQKHWTSSPKVYAHVYIDDAAIGCPLIIPEEGRPYVDWKKMRKLLVKAHVLEQ